MTNKNNSVVKFAGPMLPIEELKEFFATEGTDLLYLVTSRAFFPKDDQQPAKDMLEVILWFNNMDTIVKEDGVIGRKTNEKCVKMLMKGLDAMAGLRAKIS